MGHKCCSKQKVKRGLWSPEEDEKLLKHITTHGHGSWSSVPKFAGLQRCGKSCRLRWINYLRPDLKRGAFTQEEEQIIIDVHRILGNRWAQIAKHLPGRTDNEVKNFWNSCIKKKLMSQGLDPKTHNLIPSRKRPSTCINNNYKIEFTISQPQSQFHQKPTNANSYSQAMTTNDVSMEITRQPVLTFPSPPPNSISNGTHQPSLTHPIPNSESQNPNFFWNACAQNSQDSPFFSNVSPVDAIPISSNSIDPSGFGLLDENYSLSGTENNTILQPFEPPIIRIKGSQHQGQEQQEKGNVCEIQVDKNDEPMGSIARDMDSSFDSSGFDFEFMDSGLISDSMYRDLSSVDDFAWNF